MVRDRKVKTEIHTSLSELGLTEPQINLYTISLALGPSPIATLAEHLKLSRHHVYRLIVELEQRGLAEFSGRKKYVRDFIVRPPTVVLEKVRQKREACAKLDVALVAAMPDLMSLFHQGRMQPKVRIFEGRREQLKMLHDQMLSEEKEKIELFGSLVDFIGFLTRKEHESWIRRRVAKGIRVNALIIEGKEGKRTRVGSDKQDLREHRVISGLAPFSTAFQIYSNKAVFWQPKALLAVQIEDDGLTQMMRGIFYRLWEEADRLV